MIREEGLLIESYSILLAGREQCGIFKGNLSKTNTVMPWLASMQYLGSPLIHYFMNDLPLYIDSPLDMYADDLTIHVTGKTIEELESKLNIDLKNVPIWC